MTKLELLKMLELIANEFRADKTWLERNKHMHTCRKKPTPAQIDAILVNFVNQVGTYQGLDYGLHTKHLKNQEKT